MSAAVSPLPMTRAEMSRRGWDELDVLLISGDAYVDHPSFGMAVIGRVLEAEGFRTGIIAQPDWTDPSSVAALGRPRLFVGISSGAAAVAALKVAQQLETGVVVTVFPDAGYKYLSESFWE